MSAVYPSPLAGEGGMRSMTDEGYGVSHPPAPFGTSVAGSLRDTPHPTFAHAKATFSRKGRRGVQTFNLAALTLLLTPSIAHACSCIRIAPEGFRQQAAAIIEGRVLAVKREGDINGRVIARIAVSRQVKGATPKTVTVTTGGNSALCGIGFTRGQTREFLLAREGGRFTTNACLMMGARR